MGNYCDKGCLSSYCVDVKLEVAWVGLVLVLLCSEEHCCFN